MTEHVPHLQALELWTVRHDADTDEWVFLFAGGVSLQVASPWRVVVNGRVAAGRSDHAQQFGLSDRADLPDRVRTLVGSGLVRSATHDDAGDLAIQFESGALLQVFGDSSGYEVWIVNGPGNRRVVCQGGGRVIDSQGDSGVQK